MKIGVFGEINTQFFFSTIIPKNYFLFEIDFTKLLSIKEEKKNYYFKTYSFYPPLSVDLSLLVPIKINFQEILSIIKNCEKQLIEEIELFDIYEKIELVDASYSLGLKIIFRSKQKTLLKNEIDLILLKTYLKQLLIFLIKHLRIFLRLVILQIILDLILIWIRVD